MDRVVLGTDVSSLSLKRRLPPQVLARLGQERADRAYGRETSNACLWPK